VATVFWGIYSVLLVGFMPLGSTIKAVAYQKTLRGSSQMDKDVDQSSSFA